MRLLDQINHAEGQVADSTTELTRMREQYNIKDMAILSLRKEIEYNDGLVNEQKGICQQNYEQLLHNRDTQFNLDKEGEV